MNRLIPIVLVFGFGSAMADLVWDQSVQEFQRLPEDKELMVNFAFQNTGTAPISIVKMTAACGSCTTAMMPEKPILPGEKGVLPVRFVFGNRHGMQNKSLSVMTDDAKTVQLAFKCLIVDDPVSVLPTLVSWHVGEKTEAKKIELAIAQKDKIKITAVASTSPRITATLATVKEGEKYAVTIQPADTATAGNTQVIVQTNYPPEGPRAYTIQVQIK